jgi:hypothetical protein
MQDLSDAEIDAICAGLVQNAAKVRYLQRMGLTVRRKPNGKPLVNRAHYDAVMLNTKTAKASNGIRWSVAA